MKLFRKRLKTNKAVVKNAKILHLCSAGLIFLAGFGVIFLPLLTPSITSIIAGVLFISIGATGVFGYFSNDVYRLAFQSDLAFGILSVALGTIFIANPTMFPSLIPFTSGIIAITDGGNKLQAGFEGYRFGLGMWWLVILSALAETGIGIAAVVCALSQVYSPVFTGISFIAIGATNFWTTMYMVKVRESRLGPGPREEE